MSVVKRPHWLKALSIAICPKEPVAFFTLMIFLATVAYVGVSYYQLREFRRSNEDAHRAWILVASFSAIPKIEPNSTYHLVLTLTNDGNSPAEEITTFVVTSVTNEPLPPIEPFARLHNPARFSQPLIGPKRSYQGGGVDIGPYTLPVVESIYQRKATLYVFGRVRYADPFARDRETEYCASYLPGVEGGTKTEPGVFVFCPTMNRIVR